MFFDSAVASQLQGATASVLLAIMNQVALIYSVGHLVLAVRARILLIITSSPLACPSTWTERTLVVSDDPYRQQD
jgi:hypothetical protein